MIAALFISSAFMSQLVIMLLSTIFMRFIVDGQHNMDWYLLTLNAVAISSSVRIFFFLGPFANKNSQ